MTVSLKKTLKTILSLLRHPILIPKLYLYRKIEGGYYIFGKHMNINSIRSLSFGRNIEICDNCRILCVEKYKGVKYSPNVKIGSNIFIGFNFSLLAATEVIIEDYVLIASDVLISSENHGMDPIHSRSYSETPLTAKSVHIGEGCWLGEKSMIMPGVSLGKRCIVAAGAIVTKSFPDYCLIAGVPAKCIKKFNHSNQKWEAITTVIK